MRPKAWGAAEGRFFLLISDGESDSFSFLFCLLVSCFYTYGYVSTVLYPIFFIVFLILFDFMHDSVNLEIF